MSAEHLVCRVRTRLCAIPISQVIEIARPRPVEPLPDAPHFVSGLALIRGSATPVVDARLLLSEEPVETATRIVTVRAGERVVAVAVDEVLGVRILPSDALSDSPPLAEQALSGAISAIARLDRELLVVLESSRLVPERVWNTIAEAYA